MESVCQIEKSCEWERQNNKIQGNVFELSVTATNRGKQMSKKRTADSSMDQTSYREKQIKKIKQQQVEGKKQREKKIGIFSYDPVCYGRLVVFVGYFLGLQKKNSELATS